MTDELFDVIFPPEMHRVPREHCHRERDCDRLREYYDRQNCAKRQFGFDLADGDGQRGRQKSELRDAYGGSIASFAEDHAGFQLGFVKVDRLVMDDVRIMAAYESG